MDTTPIDAGIGVIFYQGLSSLSGLLGGLSISFFWRPKKLHQRGRFAAGLIIGSISVSASFAFTGLTSRWLGMNIGEIDIALGVGYFVGAISVGAIAWLGNFFSHREDSDLLEVVSDIKSTVSWAPPPAKTKRRAPSSKTKQKEDDDEYNL
ncbi:hypothetical protein SOASR030_00950 [Leminorella grimontii]|uniref:Uncharacterized protein n=1 Tax=Leminorella grimontii TaxID=82981 RepID=A0AAV5MVX3_9GAMM|nr:hypothetical protein [Leminorella grimontii]KFC95448.1 hypothetical protein GLGR_1989 [Leminorella grimontii ATCC 33999 = DSM 5078]GKX53983.1 hypothetical protein SOASR030_00950 [Leminorella grimontii]VFS60398.1 Uncharacterised protein [Leminorella grimontii]